MPKFGKNDFHKFLLSVFKMNDTFNFEDNFWYIFSGYQIIIFHLKVCNTDCIMPGFDKQFICNNFYLVV